MIPPPATYRVHEGDTVQEIATLLGVDENALAQENGLSEPYHMHVGQILRVPGGYGDGTLARDAGPAGDPNMAYVPPGRSGDLPPIAPRSRSQTLALASGRGFGSSGGSVSAPPPRRCYSPLPRRRRRCSPAPTSRRSPSRSSWAHRRPATRRRRSSSVAALPPQRASQTAARTATGSADSGRTSRRRRNAPAPPAAVPITAPHAQTGDGAITAAVPAHRISSGRSAARRSKGSAAIRFGSDQ